MRVTLRASCDEQTAHASYARAIVGHGVTESDVRDQDVVGRLFLPDAEGDAPAAVLLAGSGGGTGEPLTGALLAGHGVAALCLAHWNFPGLPDAMHGIDVEIVGAACDWLRAQPGVLDAAPTVIGTSRGGELALLAAALLPEQVGDVVSQVGSALPWGAFGPGVDVNDPAWLFGGEPIAKLHEDPDDDLAALDDPEQVAAAEVAIEKTSGRVLLLSGGGRPDLAQRQAQRVRRRAGPPARRGRPGGARGLSRRRSPGLPATRRSRRRPRSCIRSMGAFAGSGVPAPATRPPAATRGGDCSSSREPGDDGRRDPPGRRR